MSVRAARQSEIYALSESSQMHSEQQVAGEHRSEGSDGPAGCHLSDRIEDLIDSSRGHEHGDQGGDAERCA